MNPQVEAIVVEAAQSCVRFLLAATFAEAAGQYEKAANLRDEAESESGLAFYAVGNGR